MASVIRGDDNFDSEAGSALKAWVTFNGEGTVAISADYNVGSITDHGTGDYTINFTTSMSDTNYALTGSITRPNDAVNLLGMVYVKRLGKATGSVRVRTAWADSNLIDMAYVDVAIFR